MITKSKKLHSKQEEKSMVASYVGYKIVLHIYAETYTQHISLQGSVRKFHHRVIQEAQYCQRPFLPSCGHTRLLSNRSHKQYNIVVCGTTTSILSPLFYLFNSSVLFSVFANVTCDIYVRTTSYFLTTPILSLLLVLLHSMAVICFRVYIMPLYAWQPKCLYITSF